MASRTRGPAPHVGVTIRQRRLQLGLRTEDLASKTGLSEATIRRIERGEDARLRTLESIAAALDTTLGALLNGEAA